MSEMLDLFTLTEADWLEKRHSNRVDEHRSRLSAAYTRIIMTIRVLRKTLSKRRSFCHDETTLVLVPVFGVLMVFQVKPIRPGA